MSGPNTRNRGKWIDHGEGAKLFYKRNSLKANVQLAVTAEMGDGREEDGGAFVRSALQRSCTCLCAAEPCARLGAARFCLRNQVDVIKHCYLTFIFTWAPRHAQPPTASHRSFLRGGTTLPSLKPTPVCDSSAKLKKNFQSPERNFKLAPLK